MTFFPASGYRHRDTGALTNVGSEGNVWSSMREGTNGFRLIFNGTLTASNGTNRANCFPLRCVRAFMGFVSGRFLPGCGVPRLSDGSVDRHRFQWTLLVFLCIGCQRFLFGFYRFPCQSRFL